MSRLSTTFASFTPALAVAIGLSAVLCGSVHAAHLPAIAEALQVARAGDVDRAVGISEAAVTANPGNADAWQVHGSLLCSQAQSGSKLRALGRARDCRDAFERAVKLDGKNVNANVALVQFYLGAPGFAGGDRKRAAEVIAATQVGTPALHELLLAIQADMGKERSTALPHYRKAVALAPGEAAFRSALVATLTASKQYDEAFRVLDAGLALKPSASEIRFQFARTASISGQRLDEGLAHVDALSRLSPLPESVSAAGIAFRRGSILAQKGRLPEGKAELLRAQKLDSRLTKPVEEELARLSKAG